MNKPLCRAIVACLTLALVGLVTSGCSNSSEESTQSTATSASISAAGKTVHLLFTSDIHDYYDITSDEVDGTVREHGGAGRLATLLEENSDENTLYVDGGDFSFGTLLEAGFQDASELRILGKLGCAVTTFGNHEFDYGGSGLADMLNTAVASGEELPQIVESSLDYSGELTAEQQELKSALDNYGAKEYTIVEVNGVKLGIFAIMGIDSIEYSPSSGQVWKEQKEAIEEMVDILEPQTDVIICLSHSGTDDLEYGEDFEYLTRTEGIDFLLTAHSHIAFPEAVEVNGATMGGVGCYLNYLGAIDITVENDGTVSCSNYELIPIDETVESDPEIDAYVQGIKDDISATYLAGSGYEYDQVICHNDYEFLSTSEMSKATAEFALGDLIADSYKQAAEANGYDVDIALVGLGTIRSSLLQGDVTVADAFKVCSLGVGSDNTAGHSLVVGYVTGKELKLLCELDASLNTLVTSIKMNYSGLHFTFNNKRMLLDRVTEVYLVDDEGNKRDIVDDQLYSVCANGYAVSMLGMVNDLTKGILKITIKDAQGNLIEDTDTLEMHDSNGKAVKEWIAFANYLSSFEQVDGVPQIPEQYASTQGRKVEVSEGGLAIVKNPGLTTILVPCIALVILGLIVLFLVNIKKIAARHRARFARRKAKWAKRRRQRKIMEGGPTSGKRSFAWFAQKEAEGERTEEGEFVKRSFLWFKQQGKKADDQDAAAMAATCTEVQDDTAEADGPDLAAEAEDQDGTAEAGGPDLAAEAERRDSAAATDDPDLAAEVDANKK